MSPKRTSTSISRSTISVPAEAARDRKKGEGLSFQEQMAQLKDSQANLQLLEKQLGVSGEEITKNRTTKPCSNGLQGLVSADQIHQAMVGANGKVDHPDSLRTSGRCLGPVFRRRHKQPLSRERLNDSQPAR